MIPGIADQSYALFVATEAGMPAKVIELTKSYIRH